MTKSLLSSNVNLVLPWLGTYLEKKHFRDTGSASPSFRRMPETGGFNIFLDAGSRPA